jgi:purine-binding chemotaxis protein CheW
MTRRKPKISYRDLLAARDESAVPETPVAESAPPDAAAMASPAPIPPAPRSTPARSAVVPNVPAVSPAPAPIVTRGNTPITLAAVLNAPRRLTPIGSAAVGSLSSEARGAPLSSAAARAAAPTMAPAPAPRLVPRGTRRIARATVAGRVALDSAIRTDLAAAGRAELLRFRIGPERFALRLADVEEAVEAPVLHPLPDLPRHVLGVLAMRGRLVPVHAPAHVLGVGLGSLGVALVFVGEPALALAVDDVEDVFTIEPRALRDAPGVDDPDGVLVGVTRHNGKLVGVLDAPALALACLAPAMPEPR